MSKRAGFALFLLLSVLFLAMNRGAYKGYFTDDEIDNISWTPHVPKSDFLKNTASPLFFKFNFRPVGHFFFHTMEGSFGLDFPKYVAAIHLLHLLNCWLLWVLARRLGAPPVSAAAAVAFFGFHMALFDDLWKPMYVFDVLCATFSLASIVLWTGRRWILSFVAFWLAYRSKELAVMLPAVLACYELLLGQRRWKPLVPFFAASLSFGLQGILLNPNQDNDYTFRFTLSAIAKTSVYYAGRVLLIPWAGFALLAAPLLARNRRVWFGAALSALTFVPLLFLPGRIFSAYCYVPLLGVAIMISAIDFSRRRVQVAAVLFLLVWVPLDYGQMRRQRRSKLGKDDEVRAWMAGLEAFHKRSPDIDTFVFSGVPGQIQRWGVEGAIRYFYRRPDIRIYWAEDREAAGAMKTRNFALLSWEDRKLIVSGRSPTEPDASYISMNAATPVWQLGEGWYALEGTYRWIRPSAGAWVFRPAGARAFQLRVNVGKEQLEIAGPPRVTVALDGVKLPPAEFSSPGWHSREWPVPAGEAGVVQVRFEAQPAFQPTNETRQLGVAIGGFGFAAEKPQ